MAGGPDQVFWPNSRTSIPARARAPRYMKRARRGEYWHNHSHLMNVHLLLEPKAYSDDDLHEESVALLGKTAGKAMSNMNDHL